MGKERFDTPNVVTSAVMEGRQKKGRLRKDRYTSLLIAHRFAYMTDVVPTTPIDYENVAGNFQMIKINPNTPMYKGAGAGYISQTNQAGYTKQSAAIKRGEKI